MCQADATRCNYAREFGINVDSALLGDIPMLVIRRSPVCRAYAMRYVIRCSPICRAMLHIANRTILLRRV